MIYIYIYTYIYIDRYIVVASNILGALVFVSLLVFICWPLWGLLNELLFLVCSCSGEDNATNIENYDYVAINSKVVSYLFLVLLQSSMK